MSRCSVVSFGRREFLCIYAYALYTKTNEHEPLRRPAHYVPNLLRTSSRVSRREGANGQPLRGMRKRKTRTIRTTEPFTRGQIKRSRVLPGHYLLSRIGPHHYASCRVHAVSAEGSHVAIVIILYSRCHSTLRYERMKRHGLLV